MILIRNATILTMNASFDVLTGDVVVREGQIVHVGGNAPSGIADDTEPTHVIEARGGYLLPGFVQTHVHLCQTLFRGHADDLPLLEWLRRRIWPMEAAHTPASLAASVRLAAAELLLGGTTCALTMETVHDTDVIFETLEGTGLRAVVGKCLMDAADIPVPPRLRETTRSAIDESLALAARWHGAAGGRLRAAFAPRFALSCSRELLESVAQLASERGLLVHTHAAEQRDEVALVRERTGCHNIEYFERVGLGAARLCIAHCVWVDAAEQHRLARLNAHVLHCPGSNLKLASGIAPIVEMRRKGIGVSLGADGAACNNRLDMFAEMRLASGLQAVRHGAGALTARDVLTMATRDGARALGLDDRIGSIEAGKRADIVLIDRDRPHLATCPDPYGAIVFAATPADVRTTLVDGLVVVNDFHLTGIDHEAALADAREQAAALARRAGAG